MQADQRVGTDMAHAHHHRDPPLPEAQVDGVVQHRRRHVPDHGAEEDERHDGVVDAVVPLDVRDERAEGAVVGAQDGEGVEGPEDAEDVGARPVPALQGGDHGVGCR